MNSDDQLPPPRLDIAVDDRSDPAMVQLRGELDPVTSPRLKACLEEIVARSRRLCLDVSELSFIDSSGINVLVRTGLDLQPDGWVRLLHPSEHLRNVVTTIGLDDLLQEDTSHYDPYYQTWKDPPRAQRESVGNPSS